MIKKVNNQKDLVEQEKTKPAILLKYKHEKRRKCALDENDHKK